MRGAGFARRDAATERRSAGRNLVRSPADDDAGSRAHQSSPRSKRGDRRVACELNAASPVSVVLVRCRDRRSRLPDFRISTEGWPGSARREACGFTMSSAAFESRSELVLTVCDLDREDALGHAQRSSLMSRACVKAHVSCWQRFPR
jgi:hypothetical protein